MLGQIAPNTWLIDGNPTGASLSILDAPKGATVIDRTTGVAYQKTTGYGDNSGFAESGTANAGGNTLIVDKDGSDSTGAREGAPFLTFGGAAAAALSGDVIIVRPGEYTVAADFRVAGVKWILQPNVTANGVAIGGYDWHQSTIWYVINLDAVPSDVDRIDRFFRMLDAGGILDALSDLIFLRSGQNNGTSTPISLLGTAATLAGSMPWTTDGVGLNGTTAQHISLTVPTIAAGSGYTIIADIQGATGQTSSAQILGILNSAGSTTAGCALRLVTTNDGRIYTKQGGAETVSTNGAEYDYNAFTVHYYNPLQQIVAITNDGTATPTLALYVDGKQMLTDGSGNTQITSSLSLLTVGGRFTSGSSWDLPFKGQCGFVAIFNRALTESENLAAFQAVRLLDSHPTQFVVMSDSLGTILPDATRGFGGWAWLMMQLPPWAGHARLFNPSLGSGAWAETSITAYPLRAARYAPPSGVESFFVVQLGTNETINSVSAATVIANLKALYALASADGHKIIGMLIPPARVGIYSGAQETIRSTINSAISEMVGKELVAAWDWSTFFQPYTAGALYVDNYHPSVSGNLAASKFHINGVLDIGALATVGNLPAAASSTGRRLIVSDSNAASFTLGIGAVVAAGGATVVPVVSDGTNWRIG